ncbi:hypothetical protein E1B28_010621 [Marasmius oreades]|uniref:BHLH domain-containing protein n=1 Tax=Marasmius oreades TaxID=181124 RepID=A0A9P7RXP4_9AGAR|nr:uncharacterized protein E1B28_010621 [Marasmius oreades]KAG7091602.1 hypothetical protein E1B28_010621 [Marasmius oreades]
MSSQFPVSSESPPSIPSSSQSFSVTPDLPTQALVPVQSTSRRDTRKKKKPSTEEQRATHNAVEKARRENLNESFLDLAKLIPSIAQHRKPSKALIITSSISYLHASRRHRAMAARELRSLHMEAENLRKEVNNWRDHAGIKRIDEPKRSVAFGMISRGELLLDDTATSGSEVLEEEGLEVEHDREEAAEPARPEPSPSPPAAVPSPPYQQQHGPPRYIYSREQFESPNPWFGPQGHIRSTSYSQSRQPPGPYLQATNPPNPIANPGWPNTTTHGLQREWGTSEWHQHRP